MDLLREEMSGNAWKWGEGTPKCFCSPERENPFESYPWRKDCRCLKQRLEGAG